jgi:recombination associated protein RdgC
MRTELLTKAFSKKTASLAWIDREARLLVIEAGSQSRADDVVTMLVRDLPGLAVTPVNTKLSPVTAMSAWLNTQELPVLFTADRDCLLRATDDSKATVRYGHHALDIQEIRANIEGGKPPCTSGP